MKKNNGEIFTSNELSSYKIMQSRAALVSVGILIMLAIGIFAVTASSAAENIQSFEWVTGTIVFFTCVFAAAGAAFLLWGNYALAKVLERSNVLIQSEIDEKNHLQERMSYLECHDYLTGLPNMQLLIDRINQAIKSAHGPEKPFGVVFLDLDDFQTINYTAGHEQGDVLLKEAAKRISGCLNGNDIAARYGEDEFVILIQNLQFSNNIKDIIDMLMDCFRQPFRIEHQDYHVTASIGIAVYPLDGENVETILKNADIALLKAKKKGKGQIAVCTPLMKEKVTEVMKMTGLLYHAIERNELSVYYQPQVNCITGKIIGFEALLRWKQPELGFVSPDKFIPIAEHTGLIVPIGEWVLRQACLQNKKWQQAGFTNLRMGVNLSLVQVMNGDIENQVRRILSETGLKPEFLELEVTESTAMQHDFKVIEILKNLKALGITLSIDDFGMEYSSLKRLKDMPIDRIKIAMPFIHGIADNNKDEAITKTIINLARYMGIYTIAEGVETKPQLDFLQERKCDEIQGFYFYKPLAAAEIEALLKADGLLSRQAITA